MIKSFETNYQIPRPDFVPRKDHDLAVKTLGEFQDHKVAEQQSIHAKFEDIRSAATASLIKYMGPEKYEAYENFRADLADESLRWPILEKPNDKYDLQFRAQAWFKENRIDPSQLAQLWEVFSGQAKKLWTDVRKNIPKLEGKEELALKNATVDKSATQPVVIQPPFHGWQAGYSYSDNGYSESTDNWQNRSMGFVSSMLTVRNATPDNYDWVVANSISQVGHWVFVPESGKIDILLQAVCNWGRHYHRQEDRWGWSDSYHSQHIDLSFHPVHPDGGGLVLAETSWFWSSGSSTKTLERHFLTQNGRYFYRLKSNGALPGGSWVFLRFGTRNDISGWSDDVAITSIINSQWTFERATVTCGLS